jgi:hypothetical protein
MTEFVHHQSNHETISEFDEKTVHVSQLETVVR